MWNKGIIFLLFISLGLQAQNYEADIQAFRAAADQKS